MNTAVPANTRTGNPNRIIRLPLPAGGSIRKWIDQDTSSFFFETIMLPVAPC